MKYVRGLRKNLLARNGVNLSSIFLQGSSHGSMTTDRNPNSIMYIMYFLLPLNPPFHTWSKLKYPSYHAVGAKRPLHSSV